MSRDIVKEAWFSYFPDRSPPPPAEGQPPAYIPSPEAVRAVNTALAVGQPLLVMGEPGVGKTSLARSVALELKAGKLLMYVTRSDSQPQDVLYHVDHLARMFDAQVQDAKARDVKQYVQRRALGEALEDPGRRVVLIDEVDKASRDFSDGLLHELDQMSFTIRETGREVTRPPEAMRPVVIITSNEERELSDAFLRRCVFLHISFPDADLLAKILSQHMRRPPSDPLVRSTVDRFQRVRELGRGWLKRPSLGEAVSWGRMVVQAGRSAEAVAGEPWSTLFPELIAKSGRDLDTLVNA